MIDGRPTPPPHADPTGAGAPWVERVVLVAPFNDLEATLRILSDHAGDLAAVIVEPQYVSLRGSSIPGVNRPSEFHAWVMDNWPFSVLVITPVGSWNRRQPKASTD